MSDNAAWKAAKPFVNGGLSGMAATCIIQPIDMVKVRIQLGAKGNAVSCLIEHRAHGGWLVGLVFFLVCWLVFAVWVGYGSWFASLWCGGVYFPEVVALGVGRGT